MSTRISTILTSIGWYSQLLCHCELLEKTRAEFPLSLSLEKDRTFIGDNKWEGLSSSCCVGLEWSGQSVSLLRTFYGHLRLPNPYRKSHSKQSLLKAASKPKLQRAISNSLEAVQCTTRRTSRTFAWMRQWSRKPSKVYLSGRWLWIKWMAIPYSEVLISMTFRWTRHYSLPVATEQIYKHLLINPPTETPLCHLYSLYLQSSSRNYIFRIYPYVQVYVRQKPLLSLLYISNEPTTSLARNLSLFLSFFLSFSPPPARTPTHPTPHHRTLGSGWLRWLK